MTLLTIRTDKPEAELGLYEVDGRQVGYVIWQAHRQLAETIHVQIDNLLTREGLTLQDVDGLICFQGPGSFTGLRIGLTVANALSDALKRPCVASRGRNWISDGIVRLSDGQYDHPALPEYGAPVHVTAQKR